MTPCSVASCDQPSFATLPLTSRMPILGDVSFDANLCQDHLDGIMGRCQKFSVGASIDA